MINLYDPSTWDEATIKRVADAIRDGEVPQSSYPDIKPTPKSIAQLAKEAIFDVDFAVESVYAKFTDLIKEYELREGEAIAYKEAGFTGNCGQQVSSYAESLGITDQQAAETVLAQASGLRNALYALGVIRMRIKAVEKMTKKADVEALKNTLLAEIAEIASKL